MRGLFDVQHLVSGSARELPGAAAVLAAENALFVARQQNAATARIHADGLRVFAMEPRRGVAPGRAAVVADADPASVGEVDVAGSICDRPRRRSAR